MSNTELTAISPVDGRYAEKVSELRPIFSEFGLNRYRVLVEIRWFQFITQLLKDTGLSSLSEHSNRLLNNIIDNFNEEDARRIKNIEKTTHHDVKAIEYFLKEKIQGNKELEKISEFIHFACTSEDINNLAYALMLKTARNQIMLPLMDEIINTLTRMAHEYADIPMLSRTHGQPATPTTMGKELANFVARLSEQRHQYSSVPIQGKINGAVGNFNAHVIAYPEIDWLAASREFVEKLGLTWTTYTTQIEPHDYIAAYCHCLIRFNNILIDLNRDLWGYISLNYFQQKTISSEVGSSTMPHKVNPIHFENSEGNLSFANAIFDFLAMRLTISRWQRDLVDSTLLRNLGVGHAHTVIAFRALLQGLDRLAINSELLTEELQEHWEVLTEAIQTVMRRYGIPNPYEKLKAFSRGKTLDANAIQTFIGELALPSAIKQRLLGLRPEEYIGLAKILAKTLNY